MKRLVISFVAVILPMLLSAQGLHDYLLSVEANNPALKAAARLGDAVRAEARIGNVPGDPSIEFSPFFNDETNGMASSELIVSMGFDFPSLYASRSKLSQTADNSAELQYLITRRNVLLSAAGLWLDMIELNRRKDLLEDRLKYADKLVSICTKRLKQGNANALDLNKAKLDAMSTKVELNKVNSELQKLHLDMEAINNGIAVKADSIQTYPAIFNIPKNDSLIGKLLALELEVQTAENETESMRRALSVEKQGWLPKFEIGYRRNTEGENISNGMMVGASIPLFSNINKSKAAKARLDASIHKNDDNKKQAEVRIRSGLSEIAYLRSSIECYDRYLMDESLSMLRKSVDNGFTSIGDYYLEADKIYQYLQELNQLENTYHKTVLEVFKNYL